MKLSEVVINQDDDKNSYIRSSLEFDIDDRVWVRPLKKTGAIVELPSYKEENYLVKLDNEEAPIKVNWYNLYIETDKDKYNFQPPAPKEENVIEKVSSDNVVQAGT